MRRTAPLGRALSVTGRLAYKDDLNAVFDALLRHDHIVAAGAVGDSTAFCHAACRAPGCILLGGAYVSIEAQAVCRRGYPLPLPPRRYP